uniref:Eukaryotic translation initiation factor 3 subunit G N-terminal domain-containing protein n=1 Tax=Brassica campestris TaxID=3711 RepID=M4EZD3_BRACM
MTIDPQQKTSKFRWGEMDEDDDRDLDFLLPPKQVIGPDENGLKTVIEYKFNDEGSKVKITTKSRVRKLASARLNKRAIERRSWHKFGDAANEDAGGRLTMVSTEEILMERPRAPGKVLFFAHDLDHKRHVDLIDFDNICSNLRTESN